MNIFAKSLKENERKEKQKRSYLAKQAKQHDSTFPDKADKGNGFSGRKVHDSIKSSAKVSRPTLMSSRHKFQGVSPVFLKARDTHRRAKKTQGVEEERVGRLPRRGSLSRRNKRGG